MRFTCLCKRPVVHETVRFFIFDDKKLQNIRYASIGPIIVGPIALYHKISCPSFSPKFYSWNISIEPKVSLYQKIWLL